VEKPINSPTARLIFASGHTTETMRLSGVTSSPSVCESQGLAACRFQFGGRILHIWALNLANRFTAVRSGLQRNAPPLPARKPINLPAKRGTSACLAIAVRRNHRRRWATPSTLDSSISKSAAWLRHASDGCARRCAATEVQRPSMNWNRIPFLFGRDSDQKTRKVAVALSVTISFALVGSQPSVQRPS
jgi:hypothetical protein